MVTMSPIFQGVVGSVIMTTEQFETWSLYIGIAVLISFMFFIIYDLGKKSQAGKFGNFILFLALGLGMAGFLIKIILQYSLEQNPLYFRN